MGITTFRDVGGYDDLLVEARQAMRYGAFDGPRVLACGRIVSATCPGGRFFPGMYREADGADEIRKAVREQMRYGADFIKVMTTGARSVELEDPDPAQLTREEVRVLVEESHRMGYRVAAHCEGMAGTEIAIEEGIDTIEHGMYLNQRPELLERMARDGQILVPTVSCLYGVAGLGERIGTSLDDEEYQGGERRRNQAAADADLDAAARRSRGVQRGAGRAHDPGGARGRRDDRDGLRLGPAAPQRARAGAHDPHGPDAARGPARGHVGGRRGARPRGARRHDRGRASWPICSSSTATRSRARTCCSSARASGS